MKPYKAVVFDMDGVLLDSERIAISVWEEAVTQAGYSLPAGFWRGAIGLSSEQLRPLIAARLGHGFPFEEVKLAVGKAYGSRILSEGPALIRDGVLDFLRWLKANHIACGVATSARRRWAERCLRAANLSRYFAVVAAGDEAEARKPDPGVYLLASSRLGQSPSDCVALEDSETGIAAARIAGMNVLYVPSLLPAPAVPAPTFETIRAAMLYTVNLLGGSLADDRMQAITGNYRL